MKTKKHTYFLIAFISFWFQNIQAQDPNWNVNAANYQYSMTFTTFLNVNGSTLKSSGDKVAAFVNGEIRGVSNVEYVEKANKYVAYLTVFANTNNETVHFKIYQSALETVVNVHKTAVFTIDGNIGGIFQSYSIASPQLNDNAVFNSFNFIGLATLVQEISADKVSIVLPEKTDVTSLKALFNSSVNSKVFVDGVLQKKGSSVHDFTKPITYKVLSESEAKLSVYEVSVSVALNNNPTTVGISSAKNLNTNTIPVSLDVTFSKAVSGFENTDLLLENAIITKLSTSDSKNYKIEVVPLSQGVFSVQVPVGVALDETNNQNQSSNKILLNYDISKPLISAISVETDNSSWWFLITFNEEVFNVDISDFEFIGLASNGLVASSVIPISTKQYQINIANSNADLGTISLQLKNSSDIIDKAKNLIVLSNFEAYFLNNNRAPFADDENVTTNENTLITIPVLEGDTDPDNDVLTIIAINGLSIIEGQTIYVTGGKVTLLSGELVVNPSENSTLTIQFKYTISDGNLTAVGNVTVDIVAVLSTELEVVLKGFSVIPNPAVNFVKVKIENGNLKNIRLYNLNGKKIFLIKSNQKELIFNIENLKQGVYFLNISSTKGNVIKKIIKI